MATPHANPPVPAHPQGPSEGVGTPAPVWAVLLLTFLGSVGSGAVTNGIFFITKSGLGYGRGMNLSLGAVFGATYIAAALLAGPTLRRLTQRHAWLSTRLVLACILLTMGIVCMMPALAERFAPGLTAPAVWAMVLVYSPATGALWPTMESYLSGGRREKDLRKAIGVFNIVWSSALVFAYWGMAPLVEGHPYLILVALGSIHLVMGGMVRLFPPEPGRHAEHSHDHPPEYVPLLAVFRVLLFASYLVLSAVNPIQPILLDRIGVPEARQPLFASAWLIARVGVFALFERWHGWHGRWWTPWTGLACMVLGFGLTVAAPVLGSLALPCFIAGLVGMGAGVAAIYCGALYYAMAVGSAGIDAGGKHEAVIGLGYTLGPGLGLAALAFAGFTPSGTGGSDDAFRAWTIALTASAAVLLGLWGYRVARRARRNASRT